MLLSYIVLLIEEYSCKDASEKKLHSILSNFNLKVRYRIFTITNVKESCPLFRQKGLSTMQKVKITLGQSKQDIHCKRYSMKDLNPQL